MPPPAAMSKEPDQSALSNLLHRLEPSLCRSEHDDRVVVIMTCGIAGSGKTTLVRAITEARSNFHRISIDEIIFTNHGIYGIDFPANEEIYEQYQIEADAIYLDTFQSLLKAGKDIVLERSFYAKSDRDEFKKMIEEAGARWVLIYLKAVDKEVLWQRICRRSENEKDANSALIISRDRFEGYWNGWEAPEGEGEVVLEVCQSV